MKAAPPPRARTHCLHGHLWAEQALTNAQGNRICHQCKKDAQARWRARIFDQALPAQEGGRG